MVDLTHQEGSAPQAERTDSDKVQQAGTAFCKFSAKLNESSWSFNFIGNSQDLRCSAMVL